MSEHIVVTLIAAVPPTLMALLSWLSSKRNRSGINDVHILVNSQRDAMLKQIADLKSEIVDLRARL